MWVRWLLVAAAAWAPASALPITALNVTASASALLPARSSTPLSGADGHKEVSSFRGVGGGEAKALAIGGADANALTIEEKIDAIEDNDMTSRAMRALMIAVRALMIPLEDVYANFVTTREALIQTYWKPILEIDMTYSMHLAMEIRHNAVSLACGFGAAIGSVLILAAPVTGGASIAAGVAVASTVCGLGAAGMSMYGAVELGQIVSSITASVSAAVGRDRTSLRALQAGLGGLPSSLASLTDQAEAGLGLDDETATVVVQVNPNTSHPVAQTRPTLWREHVPPCGPTPQELMGRYRRIDGSYKALTPHPVALTPRS